MSEKSERRDLQSALTGAEPSDVELTVQRGQLKSLSKKEILGAAAEQGWAYEREEIEGDEWRLHFRRGRESAMKQPPRESERPVPDWRVQLQQAEPDLCGIVEVDMSGIGRKINRADFTEIAEIAAAYGWDSHGHVIKDHKLHWRFARRGATPVIGFDDQFISGPGLAELRASDAAREEAERVLRDTGVDVLSDTSLNEMRTAHVTLRRRMVRWAWLGALPAIVLLVLALVIPNRLLHDDLETAAVLGTVAAVAAVGFVVPLVVAVRLNLRRRAAVRDYTDGYRRVVSAALHPGEHRRL